MKLFIPTCTLNFNNIFSTESISPKAHYATRGFGNRRYYSVVANSLDMAVTLYSKYPLFQVDNTDLENYPMVIEIDTDDYEQTEFNLSGSKNGIETYTCASTIYLNPFHCFFYFDSYEARQGVLTKAEQSLENKFAKLYSSNLKIWRNETKGFWDKARDLFSKTEHTEFLWNATYAPAKTTNYSNKRDDAYIDRLKGFLYCYLIGANLSVSKEIGELKAIAKVLRNTLAAVINSPDHRPTEMQDEILVENIKRFNSIFKEKDETVLQNQEKIVSFLKQNPLGISVEEAIRFLKYSNVYDDFCNKLHLSPIYDANDLWTSVEYATQDAYTIALDKMNKAVLQVEASELSKREKNHLANLIQVGANKHIHIVDPSFTHEFYEKLVLSLLCLEYKKIIEDNGIEEPLAIAFNGGNILQQIMGESWQNSPIRGYVNSLLSHFQDNTSFDLFAIENDVPISFAAFCQKGDSIDRLKDYLIQNGIGNYKLAFGLYGATRGFASLPKTFTSSLINGDKEYYKEVWLTIYEYLFGFKINNAILQEPPTTLHQSSIGSMVIQNIDKVETIPSKQAKVISAVEKTARLEDAVQSPKAFMYIADDILGKRTNAYKALKEANFENDSNLYTPTEFRNQIMAIVRPNLPKGKSGQDTISKIDRIIELEAKRQDSEAFLCILNDFLKPSDAAYKKIVKLLCKNSQIQKVNKMPQSTTVESEYGLPNLKCFDGLPANVIRQLGQNWQFTGKKYQYDMKEHIRYFVNLCNQEGRGAARKPTPLEGVFVGRLSNVVETELKEYYHVR